MKKINKSDAPDTLIQYACEFPNNNWDNFRNHNGGESYRTLKKYIFKDQSNLCAFCEKYLPSEAEHTYKQRVEHFHPKSDNTNPNKNWALDWHNMIGVCLGGSDEKENYQLPQNLSCDAHKDHLVSRGKLDESCEGYLINPLEMLAVPCLFSLKKRTGELIPNKEQCKKIEFENNKEASTFDLVDKTITILNLNCDRLNQQRLAVLYEYERKLKMARKVNDQNIFATLAEHWFSSPWNSFFTTRRILLGHHAEQYLNNINYNG